MTKIFSHYCLIAVSIWLLAVAASFSWNIVDDIREKNETAKSAARAFLGQIITSRQWNLMHGGVYVYTTDLSKINTFLPQNRQSIRDEHGQSLTLMNPSYMTRQMAAISKDKGQIQFHITSLTPMRPANNPYPWEIPWLKAFALGSSEESIFIKENGKKIFHYMAPLPYRESCSTCHPSTSQSKVNILGGISISLPMPFHKSPWPLILSHILVAITGILGIFFFGNRLALSRKNILASHQQLEHEIEERKQTEKKLITIQENLEHIVNNRTAELQKTNDTLDSRVKEQQRIEASLVAINDEFIQIFNSAPDGMHVIDRNHNVVRVNRAYCKLTGKTIEEVQGYKCYEVFTCKFCHTERCPLTLIIQGTERVENEVLKIHADGTMRPCAVTATPFREPGGKLYGIIEVTRDISNWKDIEQSLSSAAEHLRARNEELEDFTHVISHDLQEPLILIQAFSDRLHSKYADQLQEKGIAYLERIESSAHRMQNLIDGLLLYSRVSSKAKPFEQVNLQAIIQSVLEDLSIRIEKNRAHIHIESNLPTLEADPLQIRQLFQNIIGNSLKYHSPERRPEISITRLYLSQENENKTYLRLSIKDNGIGFKENQREIIFDIFQRLHTRQTFQGTGIGLSICKKIIDRHQGTISAIGVPGKSATFIITLPFRQKTPYEERGRNNLIDTVMHRR